MIFDQIGSFLKFPQPHHSYLLKDLFVVVVVTQKVYFSFSVFSLIQSSGQLCSGQLYDLGQDTELG